MAAYDIITTAEAKVYLGVSSSDSTKNTEIATFISDSSLWVEGYLGRKVAGGQAVSQEIGNGTGREIFYPKYSPITAVSSLQKRGSPTDSWSDVVTNSSNIIIDPIEGDFVEVYGTAFPAGRSNIRITYTAGYSTVPNEIKQVVYEMVAVRFKESNDPALGQNRLGVQSVSGSQAGANHSKTFVDLLPRWRAALKPFRTRRAVQRGAAFASMGR